MQCPQTQLLQRRLHLPPFSICGQAFLGLISHGTHLRKSCSGQFSTTPISCGAALTLVCVCRPLKSWLVLAAPGKARPYVWDTGLDTLREARIFSDVCHRKVRTTQHPAAIIVVAFPSPEMTTLLTFFCVFPASLSHVDICHCNILLMGFLKAQRVCWLKFME